MDESTPITGTGTHVLTLILSQFVQSESGKLLSKDGNEYEIITVSDVVLWMEQDGKRFLRMTVLGKLYTYNLSGMAKHYFIDEIYEKRIPLRVAISLVGDTWTPAAVQLNYWMPLEEKRIHFND